MWDVRSCLKTKSFNFNELLAKIGGKNGIELNHYRLEAGRLKSWLEAAKHSKECFSLQRDVVFIVRLVRIDMAIEVGIDHLIGHVATGRTEKSPTLKMPSGCPCCTRSWRSNVQTSLRFNATRARTEVFPA